MNFTANLTDFFGSADSQRGVFKLNIRFFVASFYNARF